MCLEVLPDEGLAVKCCLLLIGVVALDWRWTCTFFMIEVIILYRYTRKCRTLRG